MGDALLNPATSSAFPALGQEGHMRCGEWGYIRKGISIAALHSSHRAPPLPSNRGVTLGWQVTVTRGPSSDADKVGNQWRVENVAAWLGLCFPPVDSTEKISPLQGNFGKILTFLSPQISLEPKGTQYYQLSWEDSSGKLCFGFYLWNQDGSPL